MVNHVYPKYLDNISTTELGYVEFARLCRLLDDNSIHISDNMFSAYIVTSHYNHLVFVQNDSNGGINVVHGVHDLKKETRHYTVVTPEKFIKMLTRGYGRFDIHGELKFNVWFEV